MAARRLHHAAAERSPSRSPSEPAPGQQLTTLQEFRQRICGGFWGSCMSLVLALAPNITGHHQKGRNPTLMGWKGGWFGSKRILEGNIQAKGKAYDTYGGWGRRQGIERIGVEVMVWTCIGEITVRIYEVFSWFSSVRSGKRRVSTTNTQPPFNLQFFMHQLYI